MNAETIKHVYLPITFRDDYHSRPEAYLHEEHLLLKINPFYCFDDNHYGRVLRYLLFNYEGTVNSQFDAFFYDDMENFMMKTPIFLEIFKKVVNAIPIFSIDASISFHRIFADEYLNIIKNMDFADLPRDLLGCLRYNNNFWKITKSGQLDQFEKPIYEQLPNLIKRLKTTSDNLLYEAKEGSESNVYFNNLIIGKIYSNPNLGVNIYYLEPKNDLVNNFFMSLMSFF